MTTDEQQARIKKRLRHLRLQQRNGPAPESASPETIATISDALDHAVAVTVERSLAEHGRTSPYGSAQETMEEILDELAEEPADAEGSGEVKEEKPAEKTEEKKEA